MTNKEQLLHKFNNTFVQEDDIIGNKQTKEPIDLEEIIDFFWNEIEQIRNADMERVKEKIERLKIKDYDKVDGQIIDFGLNLEEKSYNKAIDQVLSIIKQENNE